MQQLSVSQAEVVLTAAQTFVCAVVGGYSCAIGKGDKAEEKKIKVSG